MRISIDPGLTGTGLALWYKGSPAIVTTIRPKGSGLDMKLVDLHTKLQVWWNNINVEGASLFDVKEVCIEQCHRFTPKFKMDNVLRSAQAIGVITLFFAQRGVPVTPITKKGHQKKLDANWLCMHFGIEGASEHARDAVHLGVLCHYDKMD